MSREVNANKMDRGGVKVQFIVAGDRERKNWTLLVPIKKSFRSKRILHVFFLEVNQNT